MMQKNSDKIYVNTDDSPELAEAMSRLEPGDTIQFKGSATLDENTDNVAVLSIAEFNVVKGGDKPKKAKPSKDGDGADAETPEEESEEGMMDEEQDAPAIKLAKQRSTGELGA